MRALAIRKSRPRQRVSAIVHYCGVVDHKFCAAVIASSIYVTGLVAMPQLSGDTAQGNGDSVAIGGRERVLVGVSDPIAGPAFPSASVCR
tara:strand:+ start:24113 stop:24382 length:270 start_codon:yes stop_codon:yes gene_type:complete